LKNIDMVTCKKKKNIDYLNIIVLPMGMH